MKEARLYWGRERWKSGDPGGLGVCSGFETFVTSAKTFCYPALSESEYKGADAGELRNADIQNILTSDMKGDRKNQQKKEKGTRKRNGVLIRLETRTLQSTICTH